MIRPILCGLAGVLADGVTLAAEILCPRDHVGERRHHAVEAALAGEPELTDDELTAVRGLIQERYETTPDEDVVDAAIHCDGCQCPWVHDDDTPITEACADRDDPGEDDAAPTAPSPGDKSSDLPPIDASRVEFTRWAITHWRELAGLEHTEIDTAAVDSALERIHT